MLAAVVLTLSGSGASVDGGSRSSSNACPPGGIPSGVGCVDAHPLFIVAREKCPDARRGLVFYRGRYAEHRAKTGAPAGRSGRRPRSCADAKWLVGVWKIRARRARLEAELYLHYHYAWREWLPDKWQRIGACETGYGKRPGKWRWNSGTYQGAFGFHRDSWDDFVPDADPWAGPYPSEAYLATPRQQYEVALAIHRRYGFSGWGCRDA